MSLSLRNSMLRISNFCNARRKRAVWRVIHVYEITLWSIIERFPSFSCCFLSLAVWLCHILRFFSLTYIVRQFPDLINLGFIFSEIEASVYFSIPDTHSLSIFLLRVAQIEKFYVSILDAIKISISFIQWIPSSYVSARALYETLMHRLNP